MNQLLKFSQPDTTNLRPHETIKFTHLVSSPGDNLVIEQLNNSWSTFRCAVMYRIGRFRRRST